MAIGTITSLGSLVLSAYGMFKQEDENKAARADSKAMRADDAARSDRRYNTELGLKRQELKEQAAQSKKEWQWKNEDRAYKRAQDFTNRFMGMIDRKPELGNRLVGIWGKR